tara:strand:+ start:43 stop:207 length:165 start_codon:yes stop_codon:yes gene_type:complete
MKTFKQFIEGKDPRIGSPDPFTPIKTILDKMSKRFKGIRDAESEFKRLSDKGKV